MEFAQGCGSSTVLKRKADDCISDQNLCEEQGYQVSSKEEKLYYDIFKQYFVHSDTENLIGKWEGTLI